MSDLLLDEYPLILLPRLAKEVGINEAIILQQMHYWLLDFKKTNSETNFKAGHYWVSNSYRVWQEEHFPFWSVRTVERSIGKLEEEGLLISGIFNSHDFDNTKWYRINYPELLARST